jgi:hypothetical protein
MQIQVSFPTIISIMHGALDLKTPVEAYYAKMAQLDAIEYPSFMEASSWMRNDYWKKQRCKFREIVI